MENYVGKVINGDCIKVMSEMPESCVDLIVTSPPYGVGIAYDSFDDDIEFDQYKVFSANWLRETYRVLKDDGRIAINIPYEINRQGKEVLIKNWKTTLSNTIQYLGEQEINTNRFKVSV